jgi:hypothetical protein
MSNICDKANSVLEGNLNSGPSFLITTVTSLVLGCAQFSLLRFVDVSRKATLTGLKIGSVLNLPRKIFRQGLLR